MKNIFLSLLVLCYFVASCGSDQTDEHSHEEGTHEHGEGTHDHEGHDHADHEHHQEEFDVTTDTSASKKKQ